MDIKKTFEEYLSQSEWRVRENSNCTYSFGGLMKYVSSKASALYWEEYYNSVNSDIMRGHRNGDYHIHDLGSYSSYCFGGSLRSLLLKGIRGVPNVAKSAPANHFSSACAQIANFVTILQNEQAGAIAFSSVNTYLAPFIRRDDLQYHEVKQHVQNLVFALNSNSRIGAEPAFSNMTLDLKCPGPLKKVPVIIGGEPDANLVYGEFEREANMILDAFVEVLNEGDADGKLLPYPILTFNVTNDFDWEGYNNIFELAAKTGAPYFANFCQGGLSEDDVFSMCCRLRLDMRELRNKAGGLFGAAENTGSIGVFTINLPALGYRNKDNHEFFADLDDQLELGFQQLEAKRYILERNLASGLYPATREYLERGFETFFSSFGIVGAHEMCLNRFGQGIDTEVGRTFTKEVIEYIKLKLSAYQEQSGNMYNLEYTPAESTAYRLAMKDKQRYPDIITAGTDDPYYTNSTHLPVSNEWNWHEVFKHQQELLPLATGGSVYHAYLTKETTTEQARKFIKNILTNYNIPYLSLSPRYSVCTGSCGVLTGHQEVCPKCGKKADVYQRVTGYVRKVSSFNNGKLEEYKERFQRKCY